MKAGQVGQPVAKGEAFQAYQGAAPTPVRSVSIADRVADGTTIAHDAGLFPVGPPDLTQPPPLPRGMRTSAPPENGETAAALAEMKQQIGQLTDSIGRIRSDAEAKLEEQALNHQIQLLAMQGRQAPVLPEGVDPKQNLTVGDLAQILGRFGDDFESGVMRRIWDVTPEEETAVLEANPALKTLAEPHRTGFIKKAVESRRARTRAAASTTTPATTAPGSQAASVPPNSQPIAGHVVPMMEATSPGDVGELQPRDAYQQAIQEYREADKIQDRTRRLAAKKLAAKKAQYALGITDEQAAKQPWSQSA